MHRGFRKTGVAEHLFVFGKRIRIARVGGSQHHEAESRWGWRRNAVLVRHKFQSDGLAAGLQRGVNAPHQFLASENIEMMEDVGQKNDVVSFAEIGVKSAAGSLKICSGVGRF